MNGEQRITELETKLSDLNKEVKRISDLLAHGRALVPIGVDGQVIKKEEMQACEQDWSKTLCHFGIERPVLPHEQHKIFQLVKNYGTTATRYALAGMRYEQPTTSFDPAKNVALTRAFDEKLFEKFVNLASAKMTEQKKKMAGNG